MEPSCTATHRLSIYSRHRVLLTPIVPSNRDLRSFGERLRELRQDAALSQEGLAELTGLHRTYVGGIERGERNVGFLNILRLARALRAHPRELLSRTTRSTRTPRTAQRKHLHHQASLDEFGLSLAIVGQSIAQVHLSLDGIDAQLLESGSDRLSQLIELANLSAIVGNLYRGAIVKASDGRFEANGPHKFPDLLGRGPGCEDLELKVALESNKPKGHLVKPGPHIIVRYVLADSNGVYRRGKNSRGTVVWIWEVRVGTLHEDHFNSSNTEGDSGKTAVISAAGMNSLEVVYCDPDRCPLARPPTISGVNRRPNRRSPKQA